VLGGLRPVNTIFSFLLSREFPKSLKKGLGFRTEVFYNKHNSIVFEHVTTAFLFLVKALPHPHQK
jgi:hypothetical protein